MPTRRVTGEMSPAQVAAVQAVVGQRRTTGEISPAQVAQMEQIATGRRPSAEVSPAQVAQAQSAARRPTGEVRETVPPALPENALGRIVPAHKAVSVAPESPVREVDRRPAAPAGEDIEIDTDAGTLRLGMGGSILQLPGEEEVKQPDREYARLYARFADLVARGESDVDVRPLQIVADAFLLAERRTTEAFEW